MRWPLFVIGILGLVAIAYWIFPQPRGKQDMIFAAQVYAHRGSHQDVPENTLAAFRQAKEDLAQGVEFDVQLTADEVPVVFHDETLERLMGDKRRLDQLSLAELKTLKFRDDPGGEHHIPTLAEVVDVCVELGLSMDVELKRVEKRAELVAAVMDLFDQRNLHDKAFISSFDWSTLYAVRKRSRQVFTGFLLDHRDPLYTGWQQVIFEHACDRLIPWFIGVNAVIMETKMAYNDALIKIWQRKKFEIGAYVVNDTKTKDYLRTIGALIITDNPSGEDDEESPDDL